MAERGEHYQHVKRGSSYEVVGLASVQNANQVTIKEGDCLVVYRDGDGDLWAREQHEFADGRFRKIDPPPPAEKDVYAVQFGNGWYIVSAVSSLRYSETEDFLVWSEQETTSWIGKVGEEGQRIWLSSNG